MKMKISKVCAALALCLTAFSSCDSVPEGVLLDVEGAQVAFPSTQLIAELTSEDNGVLEVAIYRGNTAGACDVELALTDESGDFTLATPTVSFKDGEGVAYANLTFDMSSLSVSPYNMTLSVVDAEQLSISEQGTLKIKASRKLTYESLGMGYYNSEHFGQGWDNEILKAKEANVYVLKDCIAEGFDLLFVLSEDGQTCVGFDKQATGYVHPDYGMTSFEFVNMTRSGNELSFELDLTVSIGTFGSAIEVVTLP